MFEKSWKKVCYLFILKSLAIQYSFPLFTPLNFQLVSTFNPSNFWSSVSSVFYRAPFFILPFFPSELIFSVNEVYTFFHVCSYEILLRWPQLSPYIYFSLLLSLSLSGHCLFVSPQIRYTRIFLHRFHISLTPSLQVPCLRAYPFMVFIWITFRLHLSTLHFSTFRRTLQIMLINTNNAVFGNCLLS